VQKQASIKHMVKTYEAKTNVLDFVVDILFSVSETLSQRLSRLNSYSWFKWGKRFYHHCNNNAIRWTI